ncbi:MAG: tRNA lysidine(34) synthetase TilS [Gammaproteobacteria bacterium]
MDSLFNAVKQFALTQGFDHTYWIAYSGGMDSHVLLHLFAKLRAMYPIKLRAVYINHGVSLQAEKWAEHCAGVSAELGVDFIQQKISTEKPVLSSPEDSLRQSRYHIFSELIQPNDFLLTAHHQDDQAETVLLQLFRGAGPKGLAAMPRVKSFARGFHARPLLALTRLDLKKYAEENQLCWVEDESNTDVNLTRNFLRHEVLPILAKRWPTVGKTLARVADHCAEVQQFIELDIQPDLVDVQGQRENTLSVKKLLVLDQNKQRQLVRAWISALDFPLPSAAKMQQLILTILPAREDKMPYMSWRGVEIRRFRDDLFCLPKLVQHNPAQIISWKLHEPMMLANKNCLNAIPVKGQGLRAEIKQVSVRFRQGGEVIRLPGRKHHHDLKKLFQQWNVLPWLRDRIPLIYVDDCLAAVVGFCVSEEFVVQDQQEGWLLCCE